MERLSLAIVLLCGCASAEPTPQPPPSATQPPMPTPDEDTPKPPTRAADVEAEALRCDGPSLMQRGSEALSDIEPEDAFPSASLLAAWEAARTFDDDGRIDPSGVDGMLPQFTSVLGAAPPAWWVDTLKSARGGEGVATGYDLQLKQAGDGDRRGELKPGAAGVLVRGPSPLVADGDTLAYDLSMGRVALGPVPDQRGSAVEVTRARAGTTLYFAMFEPGSGGFRFPLHAIGSDGAQRWTTEVCAADRKSLAGRGYMIVQLVMLEDPPAKPGVMANSNPRGLAVFTAETHGVTVEVFELETGTRTLAWSSDLWSWRG